MKNTEKLALAFVALSAAVLPSCNNNCGPSYANPRSPAPVRYFKDSPVNNSSDTGYSATSGAYGTSKYYNGQNMPQQAPVYQESVLKHVVPAIQTTPYNNYPGYYYGRGGLSNFSVRHYRPVIVVPVRPCRPVYRPVLCR